MVVRGVSASGQIVRFYVASAEGHGFLDSTGTFRNIDFPGAINTEALGVNDSGEIAGSCTDSAGQAHGFLVLPPSTSPGLAPEPCAVSMGGRS